MSNSPLLIDNNKQMKIMKRSNWKEKNYLKKIKSKLTIRLKRYGQGQESKRFLAEILRFLYMLETIKDFKSMHQVLVSEQNLNLECLMFLVNVLCSKY